METKSLDLGLQKYLKTAITIFLAALFLWLLYRVPYQVLREERARAVGEISTQAVVLEKIKAVANPNDEKGTRYGLIYRYVDSDGFQHTRQGNFTKEFWNDLRPGDEIDVLYAKGDSTLARAVNEIEAPFQIWVRGIARGD